MSETNQKEQEFFAVVSTGRRGLEEMTDKMQGEIMSIAAKSVVDAGATWFKRAIVSIANNDQLGEVLKTKTGLFSIYKGLTKAATMGLQIGGQFPQCYLTPYAGKAELIVSAEGYKHAAVHGPGAVLSDVQIERVYDGDQVRIDKGAGMVEHVVDVTKDRGKLIGIYGIITKTDGKRLVDYMSRSEAMQIRDTHSTAYKNRKGPWISDEDAMIEKTAAKKFLRRFAAEAEGLAMLFGNDAEDYQEQFDPPPRDVSDRMAGHLDRKVERATSDPAPKMRQAEPVEPVAVEPDPVEEKSPEVELF